MLPVLQGNYMCSTDVTVQYPYYYVIIPPPPYLLCPEEFDTFIQATNANNFGSYRGVEKSVSASYARTRAFFSFLTEARVKELFGYFTKTFICDGDNSISFTYYQGGDIRDGATPYP
jgi:hypothetical protein